MEQKLEDFENEFLEEIHISSEFDGELPSETFLKYMLSILSSLGEVIDAEIKDINKVCRNNKKMALNAYAFDEADKSIILIYNDFVDYIGENITKTEINVYKQRMLNFIQEAYDGKMKYYFDETDEMSFIGTNIGERLKKEYIKDENDDSLEGIKLYIITNKKLSNRADISKIDSFLGKKVEINIWTIDKINEYQLNGAKKEKIEIDTTTFGIKGIPCIKADMVNTIDYDAYLCIIPGIFLHKIYYEYGSKLLEGNVRAFLSVRGKINKGIRQTIKDEPSKFFAYNNGISCTASGIKLSKNGNYITHLSDLQIINGGQTTASLTSAVLKDKQTLNNIFVPMKLTVVKAENDYEDMISNIAKYANSQNKVNDSDLFSNHPFHRELEELSKKTPVNNKNSISNNYWYYERTRGKYEQEQYKFTTKSEKDKFIAKFPKKQLIKKEELAKYYTSIELKRPDIVCLGSQRCMNEFAEFISKKYKDDPSFVNPEFYKIMCITYALIYRTTDNIVNKAPWYEKGGDKSSVVAYSLSKLMSSLPNDYTIDFMDIFKRQELNDVLKKEIDRFAKKTYEFINDSNGMIVKEYCKKKATWEKFGKIDISLSKDFEKILIEKKVMDNKFVTAKKEKKELSKVLNDMFIYKQQSQYWRDLYNKGIELKILTEDDKKLLLKIEFIAQKHYVGMNDYYLKNVHKLLEKLDKHGVLL